MEDIKYVVVEDYQGGSFGTGRVYTLDEWRGQAYDWSDADCCFETEDEANDFQQMLSELTEEELIEYITDQWQISMAKVFEHNDKQYAYTLSYSKEDERGTCEVYSIDDDEEAELLCEWLISAIPEDIVSELGEKIDSHYDSLDSNKDN